MYVKEFHFNSSQSKRFTPVWAGLHGRPHCPPLELMIPPAGLDPPSVNTLRQSQQTTYLLCLEVSCICLRGWNKPTSSKNCCVRRRMCLSSVSSRKFFFSASWLVLISFSSFSSFSKVACQSQSRDTQCYVMDFVDFCAACNTISAIKLVGQRNNLGSSTSLCNPIHDFLTDTPQTILIGHHTSSNLVFNTRVDATFVASSGVYADCYYLNASHLTLTYLTHTLL